MTDHLTLERTGATVVPFGVGGSELLIRTIREIGIDAISCTPSYPAVLERVIEEQFPGLHPRDLGLKLGLFGGEPGLDDPRLRDRTGDIIAIDHTDPCRCGRTGMRFRVVGRSDDMVVVRGLIGVAWRVVGDARLMAEAVVVATQLSTLPPLSVRAMKRVLNHSSLSDLNRALELETEATVTGFLDPETTNRLKDF